MNLVVTVDENWAIGKGDRQLAQIPGNQRYFQQLTLGKTVVMGRKTLQAMPQGQPLYGRNNLVFSQNGEFKVRGAVKLPSVESFLKDGDLGEDVFVCGGDSIYKALFDRCDTAYVTMLEKSYDADRHFPNLDDDPEWVMTEESDEQTCFDITYYFRKYERVKR